jgi:hypothetical protein
LALAAPGCAPVDRPLQQRPHHARVLGLCAAVAQHLAQRILVGMAGDAIADLLAGDGCGRPEQLRAAPGILRERAGRREQRCRSQDQHCQPLEARHSGCPRVVARGPHCGLPHVGTRQA